MKDFEKKHNKRIPLNTATYNFNRIEQLGIRPSITELREQNRQKKQIEELTTDKYDIYLQEYEALKRSYKRIGQLVPKKEELLKILSKQFGTPPTTLGDYIYRARRNQNNRKNMGNINV